MLTSRDITRHQILVFRGSAAFAAENLHASVISRKASPPTYGKQNAANSYQTNVLLPFVVRVCVVVFFFLLFFLCARARVCVFGGGGVLVSFSNEDTTAANKHKHLISCQLATDNLLNFS